MKKRDLVKALKQLGWWRRRQGTRHEIWTNGREQEPLPRHNEIIESPARKILRTARQFPGKGR